MPAPAAVAAFLARAAAIAASGIDTIRKLVPQLEDEVTVEVTGQPGHDKQQLYFLALAAANGEVRKINTFTNIIAPCYGMLMVEFDQASNWVRVTMRFKTSMLAANAGLRTIPTLPRVGSFYDNLVVYRGPSCEVVGDDFDFTDETIFTPGIPDSSLSPDAPNGPNGLPFKAQVIVTTCPTTTPPVPVQIFQSPVSTATKANNGPAIPSPNPKPPGDNRSRGAIIVPGPPTASPPPQSGFGGITNGLFTPVVPCCPKTLALIPLVFAALSAPATDSQMRFDSPVQGPTGS